MIYKIIFLLRTVGEIRNVFKALCEGLPGNVFVGKERKQSARLIDLYFADSGSENQEYVLKNFSKEGCNLR